MHKHPKIEQTYVVEGSFYDRDGICRAGEFVWRRVGSFHKTHSDEGGVVMRSTALLGTWWRRSRSVSLAAFTAALIRIVALNKLIAVPALGLPI